MSKKAFKQTLMDLRKMHRDVSMREESDPKKVAKTLDVILKEAITLSTVEDKTMSKSAIKEMKQIRKAMMVGQINAGASTASYIGAFSAVLDQIDEVDKEISQKRKDDIKESKSSIMDNLPSSDTVISAIMTANPIFGYTMKMGRDLVNTAKESQEKKRKREKEEAKLRKSRLLEQENLIKQQLETDDIIREDALTKEDDSNKEENKGYEVLLQSIRDEIEKISRFLMKDTQEEIQRVYNERQKELEEVFKEPNEILEKMYDEDKKQNKSELERINIEQSKQAEDDFEDVSQNTKHKSIIGGFLDDNIEGLFMPFRKLFLFFTTGAALLYSGIKVSGLVLSLKMIYDFVNGIFNAGDILGRETVNWKDRVKVGVSNILSGILEPIDWISNELFDLDLMGGKSREDFTRQYFDFFDNFTEDLFFNIEHLTNTILESFSNWISDSSDYISKLTSDVFSPILDIITSIREYIQEKIYDLIPDFAKDIFGIDDDKEESKTLRENIKSIKQKREGEMINIDDGYDNDIYNGTDINKSYIEDKSEIISNKTNNSDATSASEQYDNEYVNNNNKGNVTSVIAPNSSNTTINQSSYKGSSNSDNKEPTHRRTQSMNVMFASGLL